MISNPFVRLVAFLSLCLPVAAQVDMIGMSFGSAMWEINPSNGGGTSLGTASMTGCNGVTSIDGKLVGVNNQSRLIEIDPSTGQATIVATVFPSLTQVRAAAADSSGTLYVIQNGGATSTPDKLYRINTTSGYATFVGDTGTFSGIQGMTFDQNGTLYGWDVGASIGTGAGLITINPSNATSVDVNPAVGDSLHVQALAVSANGTLYGVQHDLYTIDTTTGAKTLVGVGPYYDLRGLAFVEPSTAAECTMDNGSGFNPQVCNCTTLPVLGLDWNLSVLPGANTVATYVFASAGSTWTAVGTPFGEALLQGPLFTVPALGLGLHRMTMPVSAAYIGFLVSVQGLRLDSDANGFDVQLTNAQIGRLGT